MNDRTVIRPGGRSRSQKSSIEQTTLRTQSRSKTSLASIAREQQGLHVKKSSLFDRIKANPTTDKIELENTNVILSLLSSIILLVSKVKIASSDTDLEGLRAKVIEHIEYYRSINFGMESNFVALEEVSYGVCCFLDEIVLNTPWGAKSSWASESLLVTFHKEAWGGERFFEYLEKMSLNPPTYIYPLELYYALLELGFEGKHRQSNDGMRALQTIKNNTFLLLERYRDIEQMPLSIHWQGSAEKNNSILKVVPQWVLWSTTLALTVIIFFVFSAMLSNQSDPIKRKLVDLRGKGEIRVASRQKISPPISASKQIDLRNNNVSVYPLLQAALIKEISEGKLIIEIQKKGVSVRLTNNNIFRSGSDSLSQQYEIIALKIGAALTNVNVRIDVTGHSDDVPIRTIKYSDNWALSEARANAVKTIIQPKLTNNSRVFARGLADTDNLVPNTSAENRALNRRVEILIRS